jgi:transposase
LDLRPILSGYDQGDGGGNPPSHPVLLTKLLCYAYCQGVVSSRQIAAKTYEDVAFRVLSTDQHPDFRTISDFRERHLAALTDLFGQVVRLARRLGLANLEHVAQDGTKVLANASKHRAMSYARMGPAEERLTREIAALLAAAQAADAAEDTTYGRSRQGDAVPSDLAGEIARRERRRATIRAAKAALEAEAQAAAAATVAADAAERARRTAAGEPKKPGKQPTPPGTPEAKAQRTFTDPDARIMKHADQAFVQASNGQAAVDGGGHQIIVGCLLTNQAADAPHLSPMLAQVQATTGQTPDEWSADCGYFSAQNVAVLEGAGSVALIPPDRQATAGPVLPPAVAHILTAAGLGSATEVAPTASAVKTAMRARLRTDRGRRA